MQCFQKDPNLRVTARKLLKHAWIIGCRRSDAAVAKHPSDYNQAVEEVKQWNKALESSETSLRASTGSDSGSSQSQAPHSSRATAAEPHRSNLAAPAKGPLTLAKPRQISEAFRSPELAGMLHLVTISAGKCIEAANFAQTMTTGTTTSLPLRFRPGYCSRLTCMSSRRTTLAVSFLAIAPRNLRFLAAVATHPPTSTMTMRANS